MPTKGISMKISSRGGGLEHCPVTQHCPQDVDPPSGQCDQGLSVPLALSPLAIVKGSGGRRARQAGKGRLVEGSFEKLVPTSHPAVVATPFAGVVGGWDQPGIEAAS